MEKGKQVVLVDDEETNHNRVCYFKNVLYILRRFFRYIEEHPHKYKFIVNVKRDVVLLQAFLSHGAQQFDEDVDDTLEQIHYFSHEAAMIISEHNLDDRNKYDDWILEERVKFNLTVMSRRMDLIRVIYGEETEQLRLSFDKADDILQPYLDALFGPLLKDLKEFTGKISKEVLPRLAQFLRYVEKSRGLMVSVPGMRQVYDDVSLLQAFLIDRPQQFLKYGRFMREISYWARAVALNIVTKSREEMNICPEQNALELVKALNSVFKFMSHWMDLIRIIYGKHPKASPPVYCFLDYPGPFDAVLDYYFERSPLMLNDSRMKHNIERVVLLRAIHMYRPPQKLFKDGRLKSLNLLSGR